MDQVEFYKLVKKDKYQVFLFKTLCSLPISFAAHTWVVINDKGKIDRYAVGWMKTSKKYGYVSKNALLPYEGLNIIEFINNPKWPSKLIGFIEGDSKSLAAKIAGFVKREALNYPYENKYHFFPGPNSNTFVQWIINNFPEANFKLPWNAFGKGYAKEIKT